MLAAGGVGAGLAASLPHCMAADVLLPLVLCSVLLRVALPCTVLPPELWGAICPGQVSWS